MALDIESSNSLAINSEVIAANMHPLHTEKQVENTLQDNIIKRGAMEKLITDRAQSEISTKVKNILRHLVIGDWQGEHGYQYQNIAKRRYQHIKKMTNYLLDWPGAPEKFGRFIDILENVEYPLILPFLGRGYTAY